MMTRQQAEIVLDGMSLDECIKMWNESGADHYCRIWEIHEVDEDGWWDYLSGELGAHHIAKTLWESRADGFFSHYDRFYFYDDNDCRLYSFDTKDGLMELLGLWFIVELINR